MMSGSGQLMSVVDVATGIFVLTLFAAAAAVASLGFLSVFVLRRAGENGVTGLIWGGGLVLAGLLLAALLLGRSPFPEIDVQRRAIEARAADLTARAIAPGSALACLDAVANPAVESACEKAVFASPESVAAAVAYVDARYSLLVASAALAARDTSYQPAVERLRRGLEEDHFGVVAHVLSTRGCNTLDCPDLAYLRETSRILSNMKSHAFAGHIGVHALAWNTGGALSAVAAASPPASPNPTPPQPAAALNTMPAMPPAVAPSSVGMPPVATAKPAPSAAVTTTAGAGSSPKFDYYPSADSIPPVSIMSAEPDTPPAAEKKPPAPKHPPARRQTAREQAPASAPRTVPPPPMTVVPQTAPIQGQTTGTR
jgi:hypothetical protein